MEKWLSKERVALFTLMILSIGALHTPHADGEVLCVGADGHVEVEAAAGLVCATQDGPIPEVHGHFDGGPRSMMSPVESDHCGECTDVPLMAHHETELFNTRVQTIDFCAPTLSSQRLGIFDFPAGSELRTAEIFGHPLSFALTLLRSVSLQR